MYCQRHDLIRSLQQVILLGGGVSATLVGVHMRAAGTTDAFVRVEGEAIVGDALGAILFVLTQLGSLSRFAGYGTGVLSAWMQAL